ncbi:hypothetical protein IJG44_01730 [bacterium]|nr:hypothetical protein [bacterium]MBQ4439182.1 hypothetical protein [bacterium]
MKTKHEIFKVLPGAGTPVDQKCVKGAQKIKNSRNNITKIGFSFGKTILTFSFCLKQQNRKAAPQSRGLRSQTPTKVPVKPNDATKENKKSCSFAARTAFPGAKMTTKENSEKTAAISQSLLFLRSLKRETNTKIIRRSIETSLEPITKIPIKINKIQILLFLIESKHERKITIAIFAGA